MQDQAAFDAMAKDVEERTQRRREQKAACDKEREAGNLAFKAGQYTEALAAYSRAAEHFKGDKAVYANRALAHLKLRNALSALEDASRAIEIAKFLDEDHDRRPPPKGLVKAYVRRALACGELGRWEEGLKDLDGRRAWRPRASSRRSVAMQGAARRLGRRARRGGAARRRAARRGGGDGDDDSAPAASEPQRVRDLVDELRAAAAAARGGAERRRRSWRGAAPAGRDDGRAGVPRRPPPGGRPRAPRRAPPPDPPPVAAILLDACADRRNQLELHRCGGVSFALRALRRLTPAAPAAGDGEAAESSDDVAAASAGAGGGGGGSPRSFMLARCCAHEKVRSGAAPRGVEGAADRLVPSAGSEGAPPPLHAAAAARRSPRSPTGGEGEGAIRGARAAALRFLVRLIGGGGAIASSSRR